MLKTSSLSVGERAADFTLHDAQGNPWNLASRAGRVVALLFYPGDETLVCTRQLCSVRDNWSKYLSTGAELVAISPGSAQVHLDFAAHHNLPMTLLTDENRVVTGRYVRHRLFPIWSTRGLVVIDAKGYIRYRNVLLRALRPTDEEVLAAIHLAKYDALAERRLLAVS